MTKQLLRAIVVTISISAPTSALADTAETTGLDIINICKGDDTWQEGFCFGFITGIFNTTGIQSVNGRASVFTICSPGEISNEQAMKVVKLWLRNNPKELHRPAAALVYEALYDAFPCTN